MTTPPKAFVFKGDRLNEPDWKTQTHFVLGLNLRLTTPEESGRSTAPGPFVQRGVQYHPDWGFEGLNHPREMCGAPVLYFERDLVPPGAAVRVVIWTFASRSTWENVQPGSELFMYEVPHLCGLGSVQWKGEVPPLASAEQKARYQHGRSRESFLREANPRSFATARIVSNLLNRAGWSSRSRSALDGAPHE